MTFNSIFDKKKKCKGCFQAFSYYRLLSNVSLDHLELEDSTYGYLVNGYVTNCTGFCIKTIKWIGPKIGRVTSPRLPFLVSRGRLFHSRLAMYIE